MAETETLDPLTSVLKSDNDDFPSIGMDIFKKINFKIAILLFIAGCVIFSDLFVSKILPHHLVDLDAPNSKGTLIQLMVLSISYIFIDMLVRGKML